jgi:tetratricopeptide (TPR) repeat protein
MAVHDGRSRTEPPPDEEGRVARRLSEARVLLAIGEAREAEAAVSDLLQEAPRDERALTLMAKIKHVLGALSEAFACWAQAWALRSEEPTAAAQMRLETMLQMARDPERGAGEFLAVGHLQLWRKPAAMLELETVFTRYLERKPDEAKAESRDVARRYRGKDADVYKLAVLAEAWIAELTGDLDGARAILELLGEERGFENDLDRALALARVYERLGDPETLEKALYVCGFLARTLATFERVISLGRLARLSRALDRPEEAEGYEGAFLAAYHTAMHRASRAEVTAVAAGRHLPLAALTAARLTPPDPDEGSPRRQRAILAALDGDRERARELFAAGEEVLDLAYLGDVALAEGRRREALRLYLEVARRDPDDRRLISWLLAHAEEKGAAAVVRHFADGKTGSRALGLLQSFVEQFPLRAETWRALAALHRVRGDVVEAERCAQRAEALLAAARRRDRAVGRALSAAVYHFAGGAKGLVHEVWVQRQAEPGAGGRLGDVLGTVTPEFERAVRNTFVSVREYARAKLPDRATALDDYLYTYKITKEDEPSHGLSAGLPSALAFLSAFLDRPLPQDVAASGILVADAHDVLVVHPVAEAEIKVHGAYNRDLRMLLLPAGNREELLESVQVPRTVCEETVRFVASLDEAATLVFGPELWVE